MGALWRHVGCGLGVFDSDVVPRDLGAVSSLSTVGGDTHRDLCGDGVRPATLARCFGVFWLGVFARFFLWQPGWASHAYHDGARDHHANGGLVDIFAKLAHADAGVRCRSVAFGHSCAGLNGNFRTLRAFVVVVFATVDFLACGIDLDDRRGGPFGRALA